MHDSSMNDRTKQVEIGHRVFNAFLLNRIEGTSFLQVEEQLIIKIK